MHTQSRINDTSSTPFHAARPSPSCMCLPSLAMLAILIRIRSKLRLRLLDTALHGDDKLDSF